MKKTFCDKCEKEMDKCTTWVNMNLVLKKTSKQSILFDLCDDCAKELMAFLNQTY